jgi:hypothetical protein
LTSFGSYKAAASRWITFIDSEFYPDYLDEAKVLYGSVIQEFTHMVGEAQNSAELLTNISQKPNPSRTQLLRVFRKYISPDTSVEMLKRKNKIPEIIAEFGTRFRPIAEIRRNLASRPDPDEAMMAVLYEYKSRGQKGYQLTETFFLWFNKTFGEDYEIQGPKRAGKDVMLDEVLSNFPYRIPADFIISRLDKTPLIVGFARYDSDRGGAQEDDRTGGNRDKVTEIRNYASEYQVPLKVLFLNDGPGLTLGSMWNDYAALETYGAGNVMVCTLKMLDERFTREWLES